MKLLIPEFSMVAIIGPSGSGKSTFCRSHFLPTEVLSSDVFRGLVMDDEDSLEATTPAFEALHYMLEKKAGAWPLDGG
jgi:protein phosphatase